MVETFYRWAELVKYDWDIDGYWEILIDILVGIDWEI